MIRMVSSAAIVASLCAVRVMAADIDIFPGDSFRNAAQNLNPGDNLIVHAGTYTHDNRIAITVQGSSANPVVIKGADGEARPIIKLVQAGHNTMEVSGASYVTIKGLEITAPGMPAADGINLKNQPSFITIEDNVIHDIAVGINMKSDMHHIVARGNEIYDTRDTGEGFYVGCHTGSCAVTDSIIERNYVHDTMNASQGDGIEIKKNSHSNIIRDNVVHDTHFPCILLYGTGGGARNVVERNVVWNCGDSGMQIAADTVIRNNIIVTPSSTGFKSQSHNGVSPNNLEFVNNTIIAGSSCLRLSGWDNKTGMVFANNAVYCSGSGSSVGSLDGVAVSGNVSESSLPGFPQSGYSMGRSKSQDFVDHDNLNVYPSPDSPLIGAGDAARAPADDFNGTSRGGAADAGAYAWNGAANPGWQVTEDFKDAPISPSVSITADEEVVAAQGTTVLRWNSTNADSCAAAEGWAGPKELSGSESVGPLVADTTFRLTCSTNAGPQSTAAVTVSVQAPASPAANDDPPAPAAITVAAPVGTASSGSSLGLLGLGLLLLAATRRRR